MTRAILVATVAAVLVSAPGLGGQGEKRGSAPVSGKGQVVLPLPDLVFIQAGYDPGYTCTNGTLGLTVHAVVKNQGQGPAVLVANWTKPWIEASTSKPIPGFVKPLWSGGKTVTLKTGDMTTMKLSATIPRTPDGSGYDVIVRADPVDAIKETNENNNTAKFAVPEKICG
jgi:CARDB